MYLLYMCLSMDTLTFVTLKMFGGFLCYTVIFFLPT